MRVLFVLEPVIFRDDPVGLRAHFIWLDLFEAAVRELGGQFAIAANAEVCRVWQQSAGGRLDRQVHVLDAFGVLASYGHERVRYAKATYSGDAGDVRDPDSAGDWSASTLTRQLQAVRARFDPQLVIMSAQNALGARAFDGTRIIYVEQAPLPRLGHPMRMMIDPCGHQNGSVLETEAERIRSLPLSARARAESGGLLDAIGRSLETHPRAPDARQALAAIRGSDMRVALLATQPTDAVTYEGAGEARALENTLYAWASALPPGWVAVPTYHAGQRLSPAMEAALASACPRLRLLPASLSQGLTEVLLPHVDGLVTISSSTAMTALLLGKKVVVTGQSPYRAWCRNDPAGLDDAHPLTRSEAESSVCFLTHRYAYAHRRWVDRPQLLAELVQCMATAADPADWQLDVSSWTIEGALTMFDFAFCVAPRGDAAAHCARHRLERAATDERERADGYRAQWDETVVACERAERERAEALAERDALREEWTRAIKQRDRAENDLAVAQKRLIETERKQLACGNESADLEGELASAKAHLRRLQGERAALEAERDELARRAALARLAVDETRGALAEAQAQRLSLEQALSEQRDAVEAYRATAVGELDRLTVELASAQSAAATTQRSVEEEEAAAAELDAMRKDLAEARSRCEHLRRELMTLAPRLETAHRAAAQQQCERLRLVAAAARYERQVLELQAERDAQSSALELLGTERHRLDGEMAALLAERHDLRAALTDAQARCERANQHSSTTASRLRESEAQRNEARAALGAADTDRMQLQAALGAVRADSTALRAAQAALQDDLEALRRSNVALVDARAVIAVQLEAAHATILTSNRELDATHDRQLTMQGLLDAAIGDANRAGSMLALAVGLHDAIQDEHLLAMAVLYDALDEAVAERQRMADELLQAEALVEHFQQQAGRADDRAAVSEGEFARLAVRLHASPAWRLRSRWQQQHGDGLHAEIQRRVRAVANAVHAP